ncbi:MAG: beta-ketoacyl-ACP synthase III, partial [Caulobacterales bacterium]|nr:beta-ketoacyl-ACP synthase III [Caulobacterales bacterium]
MTEAGSAVIAATGLHTPEQSISNAELVAAYNSWAERFNAENAEAIAAGRETAREPSSVEFIEKASGIKSRFVLDKSGVLDPDRMAPALAKRPNEALSVMAEIGVAAARDALARADRTPADVDAVIVAASNLQRAYPAVSIEVQDALGIDGFAFDMNVACSTATFGMQAAADMIAAGHARAILVVNPEICSAHLNWRDRDSHFI